MENPRMLYRPGTEQVIWGVNVDTTVVDETDVAEHLEQGWFLRPDDMEAREPSLLDLSAAKLAEAIVGKSKAELEALLADEQAGKTRKGVVTLLTDAIAQAE